MVSGQHHVGNQNPREEKQPDAGGDAQAGVESRALSERPHAERRRHPSQRDRRTSTTGIRAAQSWTPKIL